MRPVILVDNRDSFVFNLADAVARLGVAVDVIRNEAPAEQVLGRARRTGAALLLSPGPGRPEDAGSLLGIVAGAREAGVPVLGVCLGHQAILVEAGALLEPGPAPVHGRGDTLRHDGRGPFAGLPSPLRVGRYHSLGVRAAPARFAVHAEVDALVFAVSDLEARQVGLQFHPESVLTPLGDSVLRGALEVLS